MKNKEIPFFIHLCLPLILLFYLQPIVLGQSDYITTDATVEPNHFSTIDVDGGRLRLSREIRDNISLTDNYDGMSLPQPHTALRYIPNNNTRYNVTGHTATSLSCRSIKNNSGNILYISGTARTNALSNGQTEWQHFINTLSNNTQPNINVGSCFCTDTQSRYQLQTGAFCGHDYCLNEDCVIDTHAGYPANFDTANTACLANSGYHIFGCTNELCNYEESYLSLQQVPGKNSLVASGTASTLGDATQIHANRSKGFCEICGTFTLPQTGSTAQITPINRSFFGSNPSVPTNIWNAYLNAIIELENATNDLETTNINITNTVDTPLQTEISGYETIISLGNDIPLLNQKITFFNDSLKIDYPSLVDTLNLGISLMGTKITQINTYNTATDNYNIAKTNMENAGSDVNLTVDEINILNLYKISNINKVNYCRKLYSRWAASPITCSLDIQDKLLSVGTQAKSISWNRSGTTVTVTVCFRYKPLNPYNSVNDCTKNGTCTY